jgi:hypothetical protein
LKNNRKGGRRQARSIHHLSAGSLTVGSPEIGVPTLSQRHGLHASSLQTSAPEMKPRAQHNLESGGGTRPRNVRGAGRHPVLTAAQKAELQIKVERWWLLPHPKRITEKAAVDYAMKHLDGTKVSRSTIECQIVRPVFQKLKIKKVIEINFRRK